MMLEESRKKLEELQEQLEELEDDLSEAQTTTIDKERELYYLESDFENNLDNDIVQSDIEMARQELQEAEDFQEELEDGYRDLLLEIDELEEKICILEDELA